MRKIKIFYEPKTWENRYPISRGEAVSAIIEGSLIAMLIMGFAAILGKLIGA